MNAPEIKQLIKDNSPLFWGIKEEEKENININCLIEVILNYGNEKSVKRLLQLIGVRKVSEIFHQQISGKRNNYHPRTINFFNLYFKENV
ncbi:MAG: hypothetical protein ABIK30_00385 [bacterium]